MKTFVKTFGVVAGMAALLISCNKQENLPAPEAKTVEMTILASSDATKTVLGDDGAVTWSATGEKLAVIEQSYVGETPSVAKATSKEGVTSDGGATMSFGVSLTAKTADSFNYYAVYPSSAYVDNTNVEKFKVELVSTQTPTATSFGPEADILVSKAVIGKTAQPTELKLQFARVIAVGKMTIKNLNTTENVKKVTFTATDKPVTGRSYIDLTNATAPDGYGYYPTDNVVLDYSGKEISADGMTAYFTCWPFSIAAGETFSVVVETENYTFTKDVILGEGKSLAFNEGRASAFNVSFTDIDGVEKAPATQLVPNGEYVIAYDTNMMTVGTTSNKYRDVATLPKAANADGSYSVDASAAWNFVYDSETDTYLINSVEDNTLYLQGYSTGSDFKLVAKESATSFTITKDEVAGTYRIANTRCIGYNDNNGSPRFAMYSTTATAQYIDLKLYTAKVVALPKIDVQNILEVSSAKTTASFPVTFTNGSASKVNVYKDADCTIPEEGWITVAFNATKTEIDYVVSENTGDPRTAYIKVYALGEDGESEATAVVTVTQAASSSSSSSKTVTYTVTSTSAVSVSGEAPSGSTATYSSTYATKEQLTSGNYMTLTLSGYKGVIVKGLTLSMKSNSSKGAGYLSVKAGTETLASIGSSSSGVKFNDASWNGAWSTSYVDVIPTLSNTAYTVQNGENIVIVIGATANSLYCQSFTIEYIEGSSEGGSTGGDTPGGDTPGGDTPADYTFKTALSDSNTNYASNYDVTISEIQWSVPGNQKFTGYVRIGGKSLNNTVRVIYNKTALPAGYKTITMSTNGISNANLTVHSVVCKVYSSADGAANGGETGLITTMTNTDTDWAASTAKEIVFTDASSAAGNERYYRFEFDFTNSKTTNYGIDLQSIVFSAN